MVFIGDGDLIEMIFLKLIISLNLYYYLLKVQITEHQNSFQDMETVFFSKFSR